ncbi:hypothetical protein GCM10010503_07630 [Streptomyces lucensis JCM 4490]|uniref:Uncharacterized protein n=1 Tax=Streptomyces lucensis JCM 4490 TaxID=1306176 RepID=A0A918MLN7_9ACTN|nr:hypothetical protein GCM10010503_07630 [Streptomyces lucensis JCM 4490]
MWLRLPPVAEVAAGGAPVQDDQDGAPVAAGDGGSSGGLVLPVSHEEESPRGLACIYIPRALVPAAALDDEPSWQETTLRLAILGSSLASVRETVCARTPTPDEASALRIGSQVAGTPSPSLVRCPCRPSVQWTACQSRMRV